MRFLRPSIIVFVLAASYAAYGQDTLRSKAATTNPHGPLRLACESCHSTSSWATLLTEMAFDHDRETNFPLRGLHKSVRCRTCHEDLGFAMARTECYQCHKDVHVGQLGQACEHCHTPTSWKPGQFLQQHATTRFPLTGKHATTDCRSCHTQQKENEFAGLSTECIVCHTKEYASTANPAHAQAGLNTECQNCHTTLAWRPASVDHALFGFALDGAHRSAACTDCHIQQNYAGASRECVSCHLTDFNNSTQPNHVQGSFPTDCQSCHTTQAGWRPARFDHSSTRFPLTGAHRVIESECTKCHATGFSGAPVECFGCHENDFVQATNPIHVNVFPATCTECHSTNAWTPSTFDHGPYFPITSGAHRGKWTGCATSGDGSGCHNQPSDYSIFSCVHCHDHSQSRMNNKHDDVRNYVYTSEACFECHPRGDE